MNKIIVEAKTKEEFEFISQLFNKLGLESQSLDEYEFQKRLEARKQLAELLSTSPKIDISDEEIDAIVEEVRAKRYAEKNHN